MKFLVKSSSGIGQYTIKVFETSDGISLTCSCPAGENGKMCKHRIAIVEGDDRKVIQSTHAISDMVGILEGTTLAETVRQMRAQEAAISEGQVRLKQIKTRVGKLMLGLE